MVAASLAVPQAGCSSLLLGGQRSLLSQTRTPAFQPFLVVPRLSSPSASRRRSLSVKMANTSYGNDTNGRLTKGIPNAEAAERRLKLNKPTPLEDQLLAATNEFLNVIAYPIGFGVLAASLPIIYAWRFASDAFVQPADMMDKVVLITGASSGIGEHMAYEYARLGARLALVARRKEKLEDVAANAWALGAHDVLVVDSDLGNEEGCKDAVSRTLDHYNRLDTLVNNAGLFPSFYFESADSTKGFDSIMDTNFWSYVYMTHHALPHLRASEGNIYVTASVSSIAPVPMNSFYNASKSAVASFYHTLRIELGHEVPITIFSPGLAKSEMTDGKFIQPDGTVADYEEGIRLRRQNGFGLVPLLPTTAVARAAVDATRRRKPDVIFPQWYGLIAYFRLLAPELLDPLLRTFLLDSPDFDAPTKAIQDAIGGGIGEPTENQLRVGGMREPGRKDSVDESPGHKDSIDASSGSKESVDASPGSKDLMAEPQGMTVRTDRPRGTDAVGEPGMTMTTHRKLMNGRKVGGMGSVGELGMSMMANTKPGGLDSFGGLKGMTMLSDGKLRRNLVEDRSATLEDNLNQILYLGVKHFTRSLWFF